MKPIVKRILTIILKPVTYLDDIAGIMPWPAVLASKNWYLIAAKFALEVLGAFADLVLLGLAAAKTTVPHLLKYHPKDLVGRLSTDIPEQREITLKNRIRRESIKIRETWLKDNGSKASYERYISKIRSPKE